MPLHPKTRGRGGGWNDQERLGLQGNGTKYLDDGRLTELWIDCDQSTKEAIQDILEKYREVRRYDDVLTLGRSWRTA